jgi:hypothetical protein
MGGGDGWLCAPQKPPPRNTTGILHASHQASSEPLQPLPPPHACCYPVMDTIAARRALLARQRWGLNVEQSVVLPTKMAEANATAIVTAANYASSNHSNNDDGDRLGMAGRGCSTTTNEWWRRRRRTAAKYHQTGTNDDSCTIIGQCGGDLLIAQPKRAALHPGRCHCGSCRQYPNRTVCCCYVSMLHWNSSDLRLSEVLPTT